MEEFFTQGRLIYINDKGYLECSKNPDLLQNGVTSFEPDVEINSLHVRPHRASKLAITMVGDRGFIFFQGQNLRIHQIDFRGGTWDYLGELDGVPRRVVGSSIAAIAEKLPSDGLLELHIKVFSQNADLEIEAYESDSGDLWTLGKQ